MNQAFIPKIVLVGVVLALVLSGVRLNIVSATLSLPPIDKAVIERAKQLGYSNSSQDEQNLAELIELYVENRRFNCNPDCKVFEDAFLSYPNELLLNNAFLTKDKKYNSFGINLEIKIIEEKNFHDVVPYLIAYMEEDLDSPQEGYSSIYSKYFDVLGSSGREDARMFLSRQLDRIDDYNSQMKGSIILNLARLGGEDSFNEIVEFCKTDVLNNQNIFSGNFQDCLKASTYYENPEIVGFVIENLDEQKLSLLTRYIFPPFALDKTIYTIYSDYEVSYSGESEITIQRWQEWYQENNRNIVWSSKANKFIEAGTEDAVLDYVNNLPSPSEAAASRRGNNTLLIVFIIIVVPLIYFFLRRKRKV